MNVRIAPARDHAIRLLISVLVAGSLGLFALSLSAGGATNPWAGVSSAAFWAAHPENDARVAEPASGVYQPNTDDDFVKHVKKAHSLVDTGKAWRNVGPFGGVVDLPGVGSGAEQFGPVGGIGTAIAVDPNDTTGNTVYLGGFGGLYKSTDAGRTMINLTDGKLLRYAIGAVAVDPRDSKTIYVGSGVSINTLSDDAVGTGMYVTHDGGTTFTRPTANTHGYGVNAIVVSPNGTVFAGTNYGLWRSTDHGASFQKISLPDNADHTTPAPKPLGSTVSSVVLRPGSPNEVTVAVGWARGKEVLSDGSVIAPGNGLYRSTQNGAPGTFRFVASTSQLAWPGTSSDPVGRTSLTYADGNIMWALVQDAGRAAGKNPADLPEIPDPAQLGLNGLTYAAIFGETVLNGLYRSADDGASWQLEATPQTLGSALGGTTSAALYPLYDAGVQSQYNNWVAADPTDVNKVYIGLEEAYAGDYRDPTGALPAPSMTWTAIEKYANLCGFLTYFNTIPNNNGVSCPSPIPFYSGGSTHPDQHAVAIAKTPNGIRMYSGNDGGWWAQDAHAVTDGSTGFDNVSWRSLNQPATVLPWDVTMLQDGTWVLGLQDNGAIHIRKDGSAYNVCGGDGVIVYPGANADSYYCGIDGQTILGTTDDFRHTINVTPGILGATFLSPWAVDPTDPNHLIAAAAGVEETTHGMNSNTYDPTEEQRISTTWTTVFTPPDSNKGLNKFTENEAASPNGPWDASAVYTRGSVSYVGLCSLCRPAFSLGSAANPRKVRPFIATNVQKGCTTTPATAATATKPNCWHLAAGKGLPHQQISWFAVDPKDPRTIYVTLRQYLVLTADPHLTGDAKVMVSHDAGNTFTDITGDLPRVDAHTIWLRNAQLIISNDVGVFATKVGSTTWSRLGTGLPEVPYRSMKLDATGRYLVAGAYGRGAWVYDFGAPANGKTSSVGGKPVAVKGEKLKRLPATGTDSTMILGLALLAMAGVLSRRLRRTA